MRAELYPIGPTEILLFWRKMVLETRGNAQWCCEPGTVWRLDRVNGSGELGPGQQEEEVEAESGLPVNSGREGSFQVVGM